MRCTECNVDLAPEAVKCPLCGASATDEAEKIPGIKTAHYPKRPEKPRRKHHADVVCLCSLILAFAVSLLICSIREGAVSLSLPLYILWGGGILYTLAVRPIALPSLSFGNYVFWNVCSISLLAAHVFRDSGSSEYTFIWALSILVPMIFVIGMALLTLVSLFSKSMSTLSAIHILFLGAIMLVYSVVALLNDDMRALLPLLAFVFSIVAQVIILLNRPAEWKKEITARLHV